MEAYAAVATTTFADRLAAAVVDRRSQLVVGLDPRLELLPVELRGDAHLGRGAIAQAFVRFCRGLIDAVCPYVVAVKPQAAFFEALGADGMRAFEEVCAYARTVGLIVIADAKRGDIGSTARAYAAAYLEPRPGEPPLADALTVNAYLGRDSLEPFVAECRRSGGGIFCLVKTSNPGGADVQDLTLTDGTVVWHQVARLVHELGESVVGELRAVERRRGRRSDVSPCCERGEEAPAAGGLAPAGGRCAGRHTRGRRTGVHERSGKCARHCVAVGHLRVPLGRRRLAKRCGGGGCAPAERGVDSLRLVTLIPPQVAFRPRTAVPVT